jgi:hypothetical protein
VPERQPRSRRLVVLGAAGAALVAVAAVGAALLLGGGDGDTQAAATTVVTTVVEQGTTETVTTTTAESTTTTDAATTTPAAQELGFFVDDLEHLLGQSASERARAVELVGIVSSSCTAETAQRAALDMERVAGSRQRTLDGLNAVNGPTPAAIESVTLFRRALDHSIAANQHYADWMNELAASGCSQTPAAQAAFAAANAASAQATAAKQAFVAAFNPLARSLGRPTWTHDRI